MRKHQLTILGKELRVLRIKKNETIADMAKKLNISYPMLSGIERGLNNFSMVLLDRLYEMYDLTDDQYVHLAYCMVLSRKDIKIEMKPLTNKQKELTVLFSENIKFLSDEDVDIIVNTIKKVNSLCN